MDFTKGARDLDYINCGSLAMAICGAIVFLTTTLGGQRATYGRYSDESRLIKINARVAWVVQECPSVVAPVLVVLFTDQTVGGVKFCVLSLFLLHYVLRTFVYGLLIRGGKPTPVHTFFMAFLFCSFNGCLQTADILYNKTYGERHFSEAPTLIGTFLFTLGLIINHHSDNILRNLRKPGETGYKVPRGGLFEYVSGANFFGEILEWFGFALIAQTGAGAAFAWFTLANIGPRAFHHHRYYKEKFDDYPAQRKALIPFLI